MEIKGDNYHVVYHPEHETIMFGGTLRLYGAEGYQPIQDLLNTVAEQKADLITLDVRELQFLNSSGINILSKFVIAVRNRKTSCLQIKGTNRFSWQLKSLKNLQRLMPDLQLIYDEPDIR